MSERYQIVSAGHKEVPRDVKKLGHVLSRDGQLLLPMWELIQSARCAVDELIDVMGRATIEAVLTSRLIGSLALSRDPNSPLLVKRN